MGFVIKNTSPYEGGAMIDGRWDLIPSGESKFYDKKPSSLSFNVKLFSVPDASSSKVSNSKNEFKHSKKRPNSDSSLSLGSSPDVGSSTDAVVLE